MLDAPFLSKSNGTFPFSACQEWRYKGDCLGALSKHFMSYLKQEATVHAPGKGDEHTVQVMQDLFEFLKRFFHPGSSHARFGKGR